LSGSAEAQPRNRKGNPDLTKPVGFYCSDRGAKESAGRIKKTMKPARGKLRVGVGFVRCWVSGRSRAQLKYGREETEADGDAYDA
jgi:hypothetical protein